MKMHMVTIVRSKKSWNQNSIHEKKMSSFFKIAENGQIFFDSAAKNGRKNNVVIFTFFSQNAQKNSRFMRKNVKKHAIEQIIDVIIVHMEKGIHYCMKFQIQWKSN